MRKVILLLGTSLVLAIALMVAVTSSSALPPPDGCLCYTSRTPQNWGMGPDCNAALADLSSRTLADVPTCEDGACGSSWLVITTACHLKSAGVYQVDGYRNYKCRIC